MFRCLFALLATMREELESGLAILAAFSPVLGD